jgi:DNA-binding winged helix-turn-helix (wHTH) protein
LERAIAAARRAVGDSGRFQEVIKAIHGRGYRFIAAVGEDEQTPVTASSSMPTPVAAALASLASDAQQTIESTGKQVTVLACALDLTQGRAEGLEPEALYTLR